MKTIEEFVKTRKKVSAEDYPHIIGYEPTASDLIFLYDDSYYIDFVKNEYDDYKFYLILGNQEFEGTLDELEKILFEHISEKS